MKTKYGVCEKCKSNLIPIWFTEEEIKYENGTSFKTGRKKIACSHLECPTCFSKEAVDDSFDGDWK